MADLNNKKWWNEALASRLVAAAIVLGIPSALIWSFDINTQVKVSSEQRGSIMERLEVNDRLNRESHQQMESAAKDLRESTVELKVGFARVEERIHNLDEKIDNVLKEKKNDD